MMRFGNNEVVRWMEYVMMSLWLIWLVVGGGVARSSIITNAIFAFYSGISTSVVGLQLFSRTSV